MFNSRSKTLIICAALLAGATAARADIPVIESAQAHRVGMGWRIDVTLRHPDSGWDHYADGWEIEDAGGNKIGFRELMHPHVDEQPFTRSLLNVMLPDGAREIFVRSRCSVAGWSGERTRVSLEN